MKKRRYKKSSILKNQRLTRSKRKKILINLSIIIGFIIILGSISALVFLKLNKPSNTRAVAATTPKPLEFTIQYAFHKKVKKQDQLIKGMNKFFRNYKKTSDNIDLEKIAETIKQKFSLEDVHILKTLKNQLKISVKTRIPMIRLDKNKYYVSDKGASYKHSKPLDTSLPLLTGIIRTDDKIKIKNDGELDLSAKQSSLIQQSIKIINFSKNYSFSIKRMHFEKYRGFKLYFGDGSCEVFLGQDNYLKRLKRLESLFQNLKNKSRKCQKIELDYSNKAFIRTKI